jgi:hypothetical protein
MGQRVLSVVPILMVLNNAALSVDHDCLDQTIQILSAAYSARRSGFSCENGGAAISNHLLNDYLKSLQTDAYIHPWVLG